MKKLICLIASVNFFLACASRSPKFENVEALKQNKEFEQRVKIVEETPATSATAAPTSPPTAATPSPSAKAPTEAPKKNSKISKKSSKKAKVQEIVAAPSGRRQPELESDVGFAGRRPIKDPFRVGEKVVHSVNYFKMSAGTLTLETRPFAEVNGRKNYQFRTSIRTSSLFSSFYSVEDYVDVLMDFEQMVPSVFTLHVKESKQIKEAQMLFDHSKNQATYWERKVTDRDGVENKKLQWEILPYAQNVFSAAFYMRAFQWEVGKENAFAVSDDEKNLIFRAKAIRKEHIFTPAGEFDAIVIRPQFELQGKFSPTGDNYIWLSDDDRKFILRIESKIKIGTLVSEVIEIDPGRP